MLKLGCVPYLNAKPLIYGLEKDLGVELQFSTPNQLVKSLFKGELSLALLPIVALCQHPGLKLVGKMGIASEGAVQSVRVFFKNHCTQLGKAKSFYLDPDSRTSQWLLKVLLKKKYDRDLDSLGWTQDPQQAEACLFIGDPALKRLQEGAPSVDLGQEWQDYTGLPFVYAAWMSSLDLTPGVQDLLEKAKIAGKKNLKDIAQSQKILPPDFVLDYLSHSIHYDLNNSHLVALRLFLEWVKELKDFYHAPGMRFVA